MSLSSHSPAGRNLGESTTTAGVVVDWSNVSEGMDVQSMSNDMLVWMNTCPQKNQVRVYLPSARTNNSIQKLQRSLLSMGCIVTCRFHFS